MMFPPTSEHRSTEAYDGNSEPSIDATIVLIKAAHNKQVDKAGNPYWMHPLSVMERLGPDATDDERRVALLHDVIEDTNLTIEALLSMGFSEAVVEAVSLLTRPKGLTYMEWIRSLAASGNRLAIRVKIADNEDNSSPERIAQLPLDERDIVRRYERSLAVLRPALSTEPPSYGSESERTREGGQ